MYFESLFHHVTVMKEPYKSIFLFKFPSFALSFSHFLLSFKYHSLILSVVQCLHIFFQFYSYLWEEGKCNTFNSAMARTGSPRSCFAIHGSCYSFFFFLSFLKCSWHTITVVTIFDAQNVPFWRVGHNVFLCVFFVCFYVIKCLRLTFTFPAPD